MRADDLPTLTAVDGFEKDVAGEIKYVRINRREDDGCGAQETILAAQHNFGRNRLRLPRALVEARELAAIDEVRVERVGRDVAVLFCADGAPIAERDRAVVAATRRAD